MFINSFIFQSGRRNTTADGKRVIGVIGDSRMRGTSESVGPTPATGTVFEWYSGAEHEVGATDVHNANTGSFMPQMGISHYNRTGNKLVFIPHGMPASEYSSDGGTGNWSSTGSLYAPAIADVDAALNFYSLDDPYAILVGLGVNDENSGAALATIQNDVNDLYLRLTIKYPNTPIYILNTGRRNGAVANARMVSINDYMNQAALTYTNVIRAINLTSFAGWGMFGADDIHLTQAGNNYLGYMLDRIMASTEPNKQVREIINWFYSDLSANNKSVIKTLYEGMVADGNWTGVMDSFQWYLGQHANDVFNDFSFVTAPTHQNAPTVHLNSDVETNGTNQYINTEVRLGACRYLSVNDYIKSFRFKNVFSAAGVSASGACTGQFERCLQSSGSVLLYNCADTTNTTYNGETKFGNNAEYSQGRNGTTKYLKKNSIQVHSAVVASNQALSTTDSVLLGSTIPLGSFMNGQYQYFYAGKQSLLNHTAMYNRIQTALSTWI